MPPTAAWRNISAPGTEALLPYQEKRLGGNSEEAVRLYQSEDFTLHVRVKRLAGATRDTSGRNYATISYHARSEQDVVVARSEKFHSEKEAWLKLIKREPEFGKLRITGWREGAGLGGGVSAAELARQGFFVDWLYTERQPCSTCAPFLDEVLLPTAMVYWSFPWPNAETSLYEHTGDESAAFSMLLLSAQGHGPPDQVNWAAFVASMYKDARKQGNARLKQSILRFARDPGALAHVVAQAKMMVDSPEAHRELIEEVSATSALHSFDGSKFSPNPHQNHAGWRRLEAGRDSPLGHGPPGTRGTY